MLRSVSTGLLRQHVWFERGRVKTSLPGGEAELKQPESGGGKDSSRSCSRLALSLVFGLTLAFAPQARAGFIGNYSLTQGTLIDTNADGVVSTPDNGQSIVLSGGNNGSGLPGMTDLLFTATAPGLVQFSYSYSAFDFPGFDDAGYLLGDSFTQLASFDGQSGTASFNVGLGQSFGFRVETADNTGEPGILTVSDFSAPSGSAIPEPSTALCLLVTLAGTAAVQSRRNRKATATGGKA